MFRKFSWLTALAVAFGVLCLFSSARPALADNQVVSDCGDNGSANQLRAKITAAQNSGGGTITFSCVGSVVLNGSALPTVTANITIDGGNKITVSGNNASRIFVVNGGATLTLDNITLTKGSADGDGGAIYNSGSLLVNYSKLLDNQTTSPWSGGAIFSQGELHILNSEFANNKAGNGGALMLFHGGAVTNINGSSFHENQTTNTTNGFGGAVLIFDGGSATVNSSTFYLNSGSWGGAFYVTSNAQLTLTSSTLINHVSTSASGGSIANFGTTHLTDVEVSSGESDAFGGAIYTEVGTLTLDRVTLDDNQGDGGGGGIYEKSGSLTLTNATLSGNRDIVGGGGGIYVDSGTATLTNVTLSGNSADDGGGIYKNGGTVTIKNTLLAKGTRGNNCYPFLLTPTGGTFSLDDDNSCGFGTGGYVNDLLLGPLQNNGGFAKTHLPSLNPKSGAIDSGTGTGAPSDDQRGIIRPQGVAIDVGAVEVCQVIPDKPILLKPRNNKQAKKPQVTLDWNDPNCAYTYTVLIKLGSSSGKKVQKQANLTASTFLTKALTKGQTYAWKVTAVNTAGKANSNWFTFTVK